MKSKVGVGGPGAVPAEALERAVEKVLSDGVRTADLMGPEGGTPVSTSQMGDRIIAALEG